MITASTAKSLFQFIKPPPKTSRQSEDPLPRLFSALKLVESSQVPDSHHALRQTEATANRFKLRWRGRKRLIPPIRGVLTPRVKGHGATGTKLNERPRSPHARRRGSGWNVGVCVSVGAGLWSGSGVGPSPAGFCLGTGRTCAGGISAVSIYTSFVFDVHGSKVTCGGVQRVDQTM